MASTMDENISMTSSIEKTAWYRNFYKNLESELEKPVRQHLKNVYATVALAIFAAAVGGYIHLLTDSFKGSFVTLFLALVSLLWFASIPYENGRNDGKRFVLLISFSALCGLNSGPLLKFAIEIDPKIVLNAFMATCLVFGSFTFAVLFSPDRKFLYMGGFLGSAMSFLFWMTICNLFIQSLAIFELNLFFGLFLTCAFLLYDTELIIERRRLGDADYLWHAITLVVDFVGIFRRILLILTMKDVSAGKKKKN